jgi:hypothetical protein
MIRRYTICEANHSRKMSENKRLSAMKCIVLIAAVLLISIATFLANETCDRSTMYIKHVRQSSSSPCHGPETTTKTNRAWHWGRLDSTRRVQKLWQLAPLENNGELTEHFKYRRISIEPPQSFKLWMKPPTSVQSLTVL